MRIGLNGAGGRMGRLLVAALLDADDLRLALATEHRDHPKLGLDVGLLVRQDAAGIPLDVLEPGADQGVDVFLDFSLPEGTARLLKVAGSRPLVIGTTGLDQEARAALEEHSRRAPVVEAPNFSTGVAVLRALVSLSARLLPEHDVELVEVHHRDKLDAPSGTAVDLVRAVEDARAGGVERVFGRHGRTGPRSHREIGVHALRGGDVIGEHRVAFMGLGERLDLVHRATSRQGFVQGALLAVRWVVGRPPGRYTMADVLGLGPDLLTASSPP